MKGIENRVDTFEGVTDFNLALTRSIGTFGSVDVAWQATPREATTDDFTPTSGTVTFTDGHITEFIDIDIIDDELDEQLEVMKQLWGVCF